jgi:hypothetical protein
MTSNRTPTALEQFYQLQVRWNGADLLPKRPIANFLGGTVADDPDNNQLLITLGGTTISVANLLDPFTQPAVDGNVVAHVSLSTGFSTGTVLYVQGGGFYVVQALPDATHVTLTNTGAFPNVAPGATVTNGVLVIPSGPPPMRVQSADAAITQRQILDIVGATYSDTGTAMRFDIGAAASFGVPIVSSAGTLVLTATRRWGLFIAGDVGTLPLVMPVGLPFLWQHDRIRSTAGLAGAGEFTIQRPGGATYVIEDTENSPTTANSVTVHSDGIKLWYAYDGAGVVRCINQSS